MRHVQRGEAVVYGNDGPEQRANGDDLPERAGGVRKVQVVSAGWWSGHAAAR